MKIAHRPWVLLGDPTDVRIKLFEQALTRLNITDCTCLNYRDILRKKIAVADNIPPNAIVRIESPGRSFEIFRLILARGAPVAENKGENFISADRALKLKLEKGRMLSPRQFYLGLCVLLDEISQVLSTRDDVTVIGNPEDIALMFHKAKCHGHLSQFSLPLPAAIVPTDRKLSGYEEFRSRMVDEGYERAFLKLNHGSSAIGVIAYRLDKTREEAITTTEYVRRAEGVRLYNNRKLRVYSQHAVIAGLIDELCKQGLHVEQWVEKAEIDGQNCDLRVLVIDGQAQHIVLRRSPTPLTNLHLLNERLDPEILRAKMSEEEWAETIKSCKTVGIKNFPRSLHVALDVAIDESFTGHWLLEANAFGDLLKGVTFAGRDPYEAQILALEKKEGLGT